MFIEILPHLHGGCGDLWHMLHVVGCSSSFSSRMIGNKLLVCCRLILYSDTEDQTCATVLGHFCTHRDRTLPVEAILCNIYSFSEMPAFDPVPDAALNIPIDSPGACLCVPSVPLNDVNEAASASIIHICAPHPRYFSIGRTYIIACQRIFATFRHPLHEGIQ